MTINDLIKHFKDHDKVLIFVDDTGGWSNIDCKEKDGVIEIRPDYTRPFSSDNN